MYKVLKNLLLGLLLTSILGLSACNSRQKINNNSNRHIVTDLMGRQVYVYNHPKNIAAIPGPAYEMVFMLGSADAIKIVKSGHTKNYPVALLMNPNLANLDGIAANPSSSVNIEDYLKRDIDLAIYYDNELEMKKFDAVDIPAICVSKNTGLVDTLEEAKTQSVDEYIHILTNPIRILADALGTQKAQDKYEMWSKYCAEKIHFIYERTKDLNDSDKPNVYWGNTWGEDIRMTYPRKNRYFEMKLAGGNLLGTDENTNFPEVTSEQLFSWNPDVIFVDNHGGRPDLVIKSMKKDNSKWSTIKAVKEDKLYRVPAGIFFIDKGTTITLLVMWIAKILHPELFEDMNMVEEIKIYYEKFYDYKLTDEQSQNILNGWVINA